MTDIVERLRDRVYGSKFPDLLLEEAADEIARLRGSTAEQRFCKPPVAGSTPAAGSLRDTFAAAAVTGLLSNVERYQNEPLARQAFEIAGFMLQERLRNGAVSARESVQPVTEPMPEEKRAEVSAGLTLTDQERHAIVWLMTYAEQRCGVSPPAPIIALLERLK